MKSSKKMKILGISILVFGLILVVLGTIVFRDTSGPFGGSPNFGFLVPGAFIAVLSFPIIAYGFTPNINKLGAKMHAETMDYAGKDINKAASKTVDVYSPVITKIIKTVKQEIMTQNFCKHCGANIDIDSNFCKQCGKAQ